MASSTTTGAADERLPRVKGVVRNAFAVEQKKLHPRKSTLSSLGSDELAIGDTRPSEASAASGGVASDERSVALQKMEENSRTQWTFTVVDAIKAQAKTRKAEARKAAAETRRLQSGISDWGKAQKQVRTQGLKRGPNIDKSGQIRRGAAMVASSESSVGNQESEGEHVSLDVCGRGQATKHSLSGVKSTPNLKPIIKKPVRTNRPANRVKFAIVDASAGGYHTAKTSPYTKNNAWRAQG